jgi:hypothetical protein
LLLSRPARAAGLHLVSLPEAPPLPGSTARRPASSLGGLLLLRMVPTVASPMPRAARVVRCASAGCASRRRTRGPLRLLAPPPLEADRRARLLHPVPSSWDSSSSASCPSLYCPCRGGVLLCAGATQPHVSFRRCDAHGRRCAPPYSTPDLQLRVVKQRDSIRAFLYASICCFLRLRQDSSLVELLASRSCSIEQQSCPCPVRGTIRLRQAGTLATSAASSPRGGVSVNGSRLVGSLCCRSFAEMKEFCMCCKSFAD